MPYPSILTVWDGFEETEAAFGLARALAERWSSHLDIACLGVDRAPTGFYAGNLAYEIVQDYMDEARAEADRLAAAARSAIEAETMPWTVRPAALRLAELPVVVGRMGWFQDLIVLPRPYGRDDGGVAEDLVDAALFHTTAPVIVTPSGAATGSAAVGRRILLAWNGSVEAMRALRSALPLMKEARTVEAVMVDPGERPSGYADPGAALGAMLSRHGVEAEISLLPRTGPSVAETLRRRAEDTGADLIVMGAYGHSRFRERMLGGATRDMLATTDRPILFAR